MSFCARVILICYVLLYSVKAAELLQEGAPRWGSRGPRGPALPRSGRLLTGGGCVECEPSLECEECPR